MGRHEAKKSSNKPDPAKIQLVTAILQLITAILLFILTVIEQILK